MEERLALKRVLRTEELPTLPDVVHRILEITGDPLSSTRLLTRVIERDPALCANLLKLVNSAYFGFSRKIQTVHDAAVLVGYTTIRGLALGTSVITSLKVGGGLDARCYWDHCLATAFAAERLAREMDHPQRDSAFVAGLLHDVGILPLVLGNPDRTWPPEGPVVPYAPLAAETAAFGTTHAAAGGAIARAWKFPPDLTRAIEEHHPDPLEPIERTSPLARLVYLAEWLVQEDHPLPGQHPAAEAEAATVAHSLGHDLRTLLKAVPRLTEDLGQIDAFVSMGMG